MKDDTFEIWYAFSFLLNPILIAPPCRPDQNLKKSNNKCDKTNCDGRAQRKPFCSHDLEEWSKNITKAFNNICPGFTLDSGPLLHLGEEMVAAGARLPLYHLFPHLSVRYSLGRWRVKKKSRKAAGENTTEESVPGFSEVPIRASVFVFESGAGLFALQFEDKDSLLTTGDSLSNLVTAIEFSQFSESNALTSPTALELPYVFCPPVNIRNRYLTDTEVTGLTLQEILNAELQAFRKLIAGTQEQVPGKTHPIEWPSIDNRVLHALPEGDNIRQRGYSQQPFVLVFIRTTNIKDYALTMVKARLGRAFGQFREETELKEHGVQTEATCIAGASGVLIAGRDFTNHAGEELKEIVFRVFGSVRLAWHSMTVMNCYMGRQLVELTYQIARIRSGTDGDQSAELLETKKDEIRMLTRSFYAFIMADDPLFNAVYFAPYSELFIKAAGHYDFRAVKNELWQKLSALHSLETTTIHEQQFVRGSKQVKVVGIIVTVLLFIVALLSVIYLFTPEVVLLVGKTPLWQAKKSLKMVAWVCIGSVLFIMLLRWMSFRARRGER